MDIKTLANSLNEGGAAMSASRINAQNIKSTFDRYIKNVIKKIDSKAEYKTIGSLGKKDSSGDIDVAIKTKLTLDQVSDKLKSLNIDHKISHGLKQIYTEYPIYDSDGKDTGKMVQVDLMFGDPDFMSSTYWAPGERQSKFNGSDLSVLFAGFSRFTKVKTINDIENKEKWYNIKQEHPKATLAYVYDINKGIFLKARWMKEATRGKFKGQMRETSERLPNPEATTIQGIIDIWNKDSKVKWEKKDFNLPLEKVWKKAKLGFTKDKIKNIIKYTESALKDRGPLKEYKVLGWKNEFI
jgi:hypothetical protein